MTTMPAGPRLPADRVPYVNMPSRLIPLPLETTFHVFPQCFVKLPTNVWWPCFYLPKHVLIAQLQETLYMERLRKEPDNTELKREMKNLQVKVTLDLCDNFHDVARPVWLLMGRTNQIYPFDDVARFITCEDDEYLQKSKELWQQSETNHSLKPAMEEFREYWTLIHSKRPAVTLIPPPQRQANSQASTSEPSLAITTANETALTGDQGDTFTVVTAASDGPAIEEAHLQSPPSSKTRKRRSGTKTSSLKRQKRGRSAIKTPVQTQIQPTSVTNEAPLVDQNTTPVKAHTKADDPPSTAGKFNRQALEEAQRGPTGTSPRAGAAQAIGRREVFPSGQNIDSEEIAKASRRRLHLTKEPESIENDPTSASPNEDNRVEPANAPLAATNKPAVAIVDDVQLASDTEMVDVPGEDDETADDSPEPLKPVELPGRTVGEKLQSCLEVLRKENESVVGCRKVVSSKRRIMEFFNDVICSRAKQTRQQLPPIMYVCGAPGSGKTMTVEECARVATEEFSAAREDYEAPPRVVYINCSHMRGMSTDVALHHTLSLARTTERDIKSNHQDEDGKPVVVFVLDEIDYLISAGVNKDHLIKTEKYLQKIIEWAKSETHLVGLVGISNSVENEKAQRLETLGFVSVVKSVPR